MVDIAAIVGISDKRVRDTFVAGDLIPWWSNRKKGRALRYRFPLIAAEIMCVNVATNPDYSVIRGKNWKG